MFILRREIAYALFKKNFYSFFICFTLAFSSTVFAKEIYLPSTPEERANLPTKVELTIPVPVTKTENGRQVKSVVLVNCTSEFLSNTSIRTAIANVSPTVMPADVALTIIPWDQYG